MTFYSVPHVASPVVDFPKERQQPEEIKIADANKAIANAINPIVVITEDFLEKYGYAALGWFSNGIPFAFESTAARAIVPDNYGAWVDEEINGHTKIFDAARACDHIIVVGEPISRIRAVIDIDDQLRKKTIFLRDINPNMHVFNFEPLRPLSKDRPVKMITDPTAGKIMRRCRGVGCLTVSSRRPLGCV